MKTMAVVPEAELAGVESRARWARTEADVAADDAADVAADVAADNSVGWLVWEVVQLQGLA